MIAGKLISDRNASISPPRVGGQYLLLAFIVSSGLAWLPIISDSQSLRVLVAIILLCTCVSVKTFWCICVPVLCAYVGFENSVLYSEALMLSPLSFSGFGDLWLPAFFLRSLFILLSGGTSVRYLHHLKLSGFLLVLLILGTVIFSATTGSLPMINNEPLKIILFLFFSSIIASEVEYKVEYDTVWSSFILVSVVSAILRFGIALNFPVKDPSVYTYTSIFVCIAQIYFIVKYQPRGVSASLAILFWSIIIILYLKPSRTELLIISASVFILIYTLKAKVIPVMGSLAICTILAIPYVPEDIFVYFQHKINFFEAVYNGGDVGHSASVRTAEFENLMFGDGSNIGTVLFGRGAFGYINFDHFPNPSVFSENSFSEVQYSLNKFFKLHFFATETIFYFGIVGSILILMYYFYPAVISMRSPIELIAILYTILNIMFRTELIVLFPALIVAFRWKYDAYRSLIIR